MPHAVYRPGLLTVLHHGVYQPSNVIYFPRGNVVARAVYWCH